MHCMFLTDFEWAGWISVVWIIWIDEKSLSTLSGASSGKAMPTSSALAVIAKSADVASKPPKEIMSRQQAVAASQERRNASRRSKAGGDGIDPMDPVQSNLLVAEYYIVAVQNNTSFIFGSKVHAQWPIGFSLGNCLLGNKGDFVKEPCLYTPRCIFTILCMAA